jgi:hypothetical protein
MLSKDKITGVNTNHTNESLASAAVFNKHFPKQM